MVLTQKQRTDLHTSMVEYMLSQGEAFAAAAEALRTAAGVGEEVSAPAATPLLEKKWTSVVRLQKKVMELESKCKALSEENEMCATPKKRGGPGGANPDWLPREPARHVLARHRQPVTAVVFHPVFSQCASAGEDATIAVWDYESGAYERALKGHTNVVQSLAFSRDGKLLASCSADLTIKLWDFDVSYDCQKTLRGHDHNISDVVFMPSGAQLLSCSRDRTIKCWEVETGFCTKTFSGHTDWVRKVVVNDAGTALASCGTDHSVMLWDFASGAATATLREHGHVVQALAFSNGNADRVLAAGRPGSGGGGGGAAAVAAAALARVAGAAPPGTPGATPGTPGGGGGGGGGAAAAVSTPVGGKGAASHAPRSGGGGQYLLSGSRDKTVKLWSAESGVCLMTFTAHENWVRGVAFHPCGKFAVTVAEDRSLRVFDLVSGRCVKAVENAHGHFVSALAVHPTAPVMATGGVDKAVHVWLCR